MLGHRDHPVYFEPPQRGVHVQHAQQFKAPAALVSLRIEGSFGQPQAWGSYASAAQPLYAEHLHPAATPAPGPIPAVPLPPSAILLIAAVAALIWRSRR